MLQIPAIPRLPLVPDPLRRCRVPSDLEAVTSVGTEADPEDAGMSRDGVERIWGSVEGLYRSGIHPAIALCVRREGQVVIDRAIGHARGNDPSDDPDAPKELATPETPFCIFSSSKAVTAMVAHLLDQRGEIHTSDRVAEYIPEYSSHGKHRTTIAHVLSHRAGVPSIPSELLDLENLGDRELLVQGISEAKPSMRPGKVLSYHAISGGFIIGEIVERVTGRSIAQVLESEILEPLGFRWMRYGVAPEDIGRVALNHTTGPPPPPGVAQLIKRALGKRWSEVVDISNDPRFLTGVVPSGNVVTTADELSRYFELLRSGGELDGVRIFEPRTIRRATAEQAYLELDLTLGLPIRYSQGFMLGADLMSLYGPGTEHVFGHLGFINVLGWADPARALSGALITTGKALLYPDLPRLWTTMRRIGLEAPKLPRSELLRQPLHARD